MARCWIAAAALLGAFTHGTVASEVDNDLARAVKATYLYKLAPFVEWPPSALGPHGASFYICILGDDDFAVLVARASEGQYLGTHAITVRSIISIDDSSHCHIVYIAPRIEPVSHGTLESISHRPVLTVTDNASTTRGVVNFVLRNERVRFEIDLGLARKTGLDISSKILELAVRVIGT